MWDELLASYYLDVIKERDHRVLLKVVLGNVLEDILGDLGRRDYLNFGVTRFSVSGPHPFCALTVHPVSGVTGRTESQDLFQQTVLHRAIANNDHALHHSPVHAITTFGQSPEHDGFNNLDAKTWEEFISPI